METHQTYSQPSKSLDDAGCYDVHPLQILYKIMEHHGGFDSSHVPNWWILDQKTSSSRTVPSPTGRNGMDALLAAVGASGTHVGPNCHILLPKMLDPTQYLQCVLLGFFLLHPLVHKEGKTWSSWNDKLLLHLLVSIGRNRATKWFSRLSPGPVTHSMRTLGPSFPSWMGGWYLLVGSRENCRKSEFNTCPKVGYT